MYNGSSRRALLLVPRSKVKGRVASGRMPAHVVYSASLPMGIPMPLIPRSPNPRIRDPSVIHVISTLDSGQFPMTDARLPLSSQLRYMPSRGQRAGFSSCRICKNGFTFGLLVDLGPSLASLTHHRSIDQGRQFLHHPLMAVPEIAKGSTDSEMVADQTVEQMHIVLANGAEVEELVNGAGFQGELRKTCAGLDETRYTRLSTYTLSSELRRTLRAAASNRRCGGTCECRQDWPCRSLRPWTAAWRG